MKLILFLLLSLSLFSEEKTEDKVIFFKSNGSEPISSFGNVADLSILQSIEISLGADPVQEVIFIKRLSDLKIIGVLIYDRKEKRWICKEIPE